MIKIKDAVILITGANRGIGKALVEAALEQGAKKIYAAGRDSAKLKVLADKAPERVIPLSLDVLSLQQIQAAARQAEDVTILINNAGVAAYSGFTVNHTAASAALEMNTNYFGALNMAIAFAPALKRNGSTALVNIVSVAGLANFSFAATYSASKAAAHSLTQGLRAELAEQGILVAGVYPGPIDTDMAAGVEMEKETPRQTALNIYKALEEGKENIFPDKFSAEFGRAFNLDAPTLAN